MSFFTELKRRNVFRVGIAYGVVAWFIIQAADIMLANFGAPGWVFKSVVGLLALGFPLALFLSWAYELTPEGVKKSADVAPAESATPRTGRSISGGFGASGENLSGLTRFSMCIYTRFYTHS